MATKAHKPAKRGNPQFSPKQNTREALLTATSKLREAEAEYRRMAISEFAARLKQAISGRSITALARELGISRTAFHDWIAARAAPDVITTSRLASELNISMDWLTTGRGEMRSAGYIAPSGLDGRPPLLFELDWFRRNLGPYGSARGVNIQSEQPEREFPPYFFEVPDDSMEPTLHKGDLVLARDLDRSVAEAPDNGVYLVWFTDHEISEEERVRLSSSVKSDGFPKRTYPRRIKWSERSFRISCDNPSYSDVIDVYEKSVVLAWRVVWYGRII
jgi:Bacteriophage CI repressor helix-turn-helix domain